jgi:prevent-host-death family protein
MNISVADAKSHLSQLLDSVEEGEEFVITRHGKEVAVLVRALKSNTKPVLGSAAGQIQFTEGWDAPMTDEELNQFLGT